ncbi:MAG TPA: signal peptidase I [Candidatus Fimenecus excrementigallinarum]|uniref:Signal peptidase I n=1 Tax=Candidatus Fimenecus excrementigallinarum TaxID=2840816 RepID=A0A9D1LDY1_9FIRM|nr:signal peptidase I [Candidatus Fimenecus excrementigallinarum]
MLDNKVLRNIYDFASVLVTAVLAVAVIFTFVFKISVVDGSSMNNTLFDGDKLILTARDWKVETGDIVVISQPNIYEKVLIKRVIATQGQTITVDASKGQVIVDGVVLDEPYIAAVTRVQGNMTYPITVPEGKVFVMGDNRNASTDSRDIFVGLIDTRYIVGEAVYRVGDTHLLQTAE